MHPPRAATSTSAPAFRFMGTFPIRWRSARSKGEGGHFRQSDPAPEPWVRLSTGFTCGYILGQAQGGTFLKLGKVCHGAFPLLSLARGGLLHPALDRGPQSQGGA